MNDNQKKILDILANQREEDDAGGADFGLDTALAEAGIDSLGMAESIFDLEEHFDIEIPDPATAEERSVQFQTIGDVVRLVEELVLARSQEA